MPIVNIEKRAGKSTLLQETRNPKSTGLLANRKIATKTPGFSAKKRPNVMSSLIQNQTLPLLAVAAGPRVGGKTPLRTNRGRFEGETSLRKFHWLKTRF